MLLMFNTDWMAVFFDLIESQVTSDDMLRASFTALEQIVINLE